jgi:signal-transduction protein with cAMP-binding, CBS, and nucleotidyltransferase domain
MKTGVKVMDAMTKAPILVHPDDKLIKCVNKMIKGEVGSLVVARDNQLLGIITEKDLINKALGKNLDIKKKTAKDIMTTRMIKIDPNQDLYDAILLMSREEVRRLPVTKEDRFIGLLTYKDILKLQPDLFDIIVENLKIREEETKRKLL